MQDGQKKSVYVHFVGIFAFASCEAAGKWLTLEPAGSLPGAAGHPGEYPPRTADELIAVGTRTEIAGESGVI
jgi:hypothetical protein